jgi:hypothetical protein
MLNMFDADANVVQVTDGLIPEEYLGLHRFKRDGVDGAREAVVAAMKALGLLVQHPARPMPRAMCPCWMPRPAPSRRPSATVAAW